MEIPNGVFDARRPRLPDGAECPPDTSEAPHVATSITTGAGKGTPEGGAVEASHEPAIAETNRFKAV